MRRVSVIISTVFLCLAPHIFADTIVLRDGSSYSGQYDGAAVTFTDLQGIQYQFPLRDVQSLAFSSSSDAVTLRNGKSYSGHFTGANPLAFQGSEGIKYQFPTSDVDAIVFNSSGTVARTCRCEPTKLSILQIRMRVRPTRRRLRKTCGIPRGTWPSQPEPQPDC